MVVGACMYGGEVRLGTTSLGPLSNLLEGSQALNLLS